MTEQDTFNALRRRPFREVLIRCFERAKLGGQVIDGCDDIIQESGWTRDEMNHELRLEMGYGNINLDIIRIKNPNAQKEFLLTGKI
jgi:hypothetical protein